MKRVVVTGMAGISPLGTDIDQVFANLRARRSAIRAMPEWGEVRGLQTRVAGMIENFAVPPHYTRKKTRSMGRVALLATRASELALVDSGLLGSAALSDGSTGVAYGSAAGSSEAVKTMSSAIMNHTLEGVTATTYVEMMSHTCAVNIGLYFGLTGRVIPTSSACTSGSQAIGYAYEAIKLGRQKLMVAGGADALCVSVAATFDVLYAASTRNDRPETTPRPFDAARDGLVVAEGAGTLVLEELEHALARGARIHAELVGFGTNSDGAHITNPEPETMRRAMELALEDAGLAPAAIGYVNAHATGTERGDIAEALATHKLFGACMPISSLKSYMGHTMGASGSLEAYYSIEMMNRHWFAPTIHLEHVDERCAELDYIVGSGRDLVTDHVMTNNFAFGGINTSLIFRRWQ